MATATELGHTGLQGWRRKVADGISQPVANRAPLEEDQVRVLQRRKDRAIVDAPVALRRLPAGDRPDRNRRRGRPGHQQPAAVTNVSLQLRRSCLRHDDQIEARAVLHPPAVL